MSNTAPVFIHNTTDDEYELHIGDQVARIQYELRGNKIILIHTEVPEALQGKGLASQLMEKALTDIEQDGLKVIPTCAFAADYFKKHPGWKHLLP